MLAKMDWKEGKGQVKEGPAGAKKAHVSKFLGCREEGDEVGDYLV